MKKKGLRWPNRREQQRRTGGGGIVEQRRSGGRGGEEQAAMNRQLGSIGTQVCDFKVSNFLLLHLCSCVWIKSLML
ncbi:hypothetical protein Hdeb2414_s0055g00756101 [Helianthus debilis subsp. tardiflorus]